MDRVDVLVVGGGIAGLATTAALAQHGVAVRLCSRGGFEGRPGGGIVRGQILSALGGPAVPREVPYDRTIAERRWMFLAEAGDAALEFLDAPPLTTADELRSVRNSTLAPWLAERARSLGADLRGGAAVASLRRDGRGRVAGAVVDGREVEARVTVLADGGALRAVPGLRTAPPTIDVAEAFWEIPARRMSTRFGARAGGGMLIEVLLGALSPERPAGGYLLPFRSGVAVGVVASAGAVPSAAQLLERVEGHPSILPFLRDGARTEVVTTSLADRPEIGRPLSGAGFLAVGRAGGLVAASGARFLSLGAALRSALVAAEVARAAVGTGDASALELAPYGLALRADGLVDELARARASGRRYRAAPGVARDVPRFLNALLHELMTESGGPKQRIVPTVRAVRRRERLSRRTVLRAALVAGRWR